jgi:hypothetical protein
MANIKDSIRIIGWLLLITVIFIIIYQLIKIILGGSWEIENIIIAAMGIILSGFFIILGFLINQAKTLGKIDERTKTIGENLSHLGKDFKMHLEEKHKK